MRPNSTQHKISVGNSGCFRIKKCVDPSLRLIFCNMVETYIIDSGPGSGCDRLLTPTSSPL